MIRKHAPHAKRVVFDTGPLSTWFYHALTAKGIPAICIEARHAQKVLNETLNKTDANDADGVAHCCDAWRKLQRQPWRIMSIGRALVHGSLIDDGIIGCDRLNLVPPLCPSAVGQFPMPSA